MAITAINNVNNKVNFGDYYRQNPYMADDVRPQVVVLTDYDYNRERRELEETRAIFGDITQNSRVTPLKKLGRVLDVLITGALSGMALHWSSGKTVVLLNNLAKKPKVANLLNKIKAPFKTVVSATKKGLNTFGQTVKNDINKTKNGKKFINSRFNQWLKTGYNKVAEELGKFKAKVKGLTLEKVRNVVAGVLGVSGFVAGAVDRIDAYKEQ